MLNALLALFGHLAAGIPAGDERAPGDSADGALIAQAIRGASAAVHILTRRLTPVVRARVSRVLRRLTPAHIGDSDDVVQKVWVTLLKDDGRQLLAFDPARGISLEAYVGMIAEREVRNHVQFELAGRRRPEDGLAALDEAEAVAAAAPCPEEAVVGSDLATRLHDHLMAELAPRGQAVYQIVYADGRGVEEAASMLGCQVQVIYNWQHKIRGLTRAFLAAAGGV